MVEISNLVKNYPGFTLNISLKVQNGCITGIVGRNGAGKSTTIKSILGLVKPDSGSVKVFGTDADKLKSCDKERIGAALAESGFSNYINIVTASKILKNMYYDFDEQLFMKLVQEQQLPLNKQIKEFSTGMKAKLRVLTALSHNAELLVLDEPTAGLDVVARNEIIDMLRDYMLTHEDSAIIISSHISTDLEGLCDDIYMIHNGRVVLHEDTDVLLGSYAKLKVNDETYNSLDKSYILAAKKTGFGYECLTNEKQFYIDNYPQIVVENGGIDELVVMLTTK